MLVNCPPAPGSRPGKASSPDHRLVQRPSREAGWGGQPCASAPRPVHSPQPRLAGPRLSPLLLGCGKALTSGIRLRVWGGVLGGENIGP